MSRERCPHCGKPGDSKQHRYIVDPYGNPKDAYTCDGEWHQTRDPAIKMRLTPQRVT